MVDISMIPVNAVINRDDVADAAEGATSLIEFYRDLEEMLIGNPDSDLFTATISAYDHVDTLIGSRTLAVEEALEMLGI